MNLDFNKITLILLLMSPLIGILGCFFVKDARLWSLNYSIFIFFISLLLLLRFNQSTVNFQSIIYFKNLDFLGISFVYGLDGISIFFIILTTFLIPICFLTSWESIKSLHREYYILFFLTEFLLLNVFTVLDLLLFYIFFESILIPMFLIIGIWGSRTQKIYAAYQFFLYTFFGSIFFLLSILFLSNLVGTTNFLIIKEFNFSINLQYILWLGFFCSFIVKIPMLPVHIWLPEAHAEAPTAGSVLLAGVLLKLGTYGLIRFSIPLFPQATQFFTPFVLTLSVISVLYASVTTLRQIDLKKAIAYSSIAHMGLVVIGLFSNSLSGIEGALYLMFSHGLVSSALFICIGIIYDRYKTRNIRYYGGLIHLMPLFGTLFLIFSLANMGLPGTSAFIGECLIIFGIVESSTFCALFTVLAGVLGAAYSMWLYNRVMFGPLLSNKIILFSDLNEREFFILSFLALLVICFGMCSSFIFEFFHASLLNLLIK